MPKEAKRLPGAEDVPLSAEERAVLARAKRELGDDLNGMPRDMVPQFIRGYINEADWAGTTTSLIREVTKWRAQEKCDEILLPERLPEHRADFERMWRTGVIGEDAFGHPIVLEAIGRIPPAEFKAVFTEEPIFLRHCVYNKEALRRFCTYQSYKHGHRIYKFVVVLDLQGLGLAHTAPHFIKLIKTYIANFSNFYPESLYKLYMINVPFIFAATWRLIKPMLHPLTAAKINILAAGPKAVETMESDGLRFFLPLAEAATAPIGCMDLVRKYDLVRLAKEPYFLASEDDAFAPTAPPEAAPATDVMDAGARVTAADAAAADADAAEQPAAAAVPSIGASFCETHGTLVFFQLRGRELRWARTEAHLVASFPGEQDAPAGSMTMLRVHGGQRHLLLYGTGGHCLLLRRDAGTAILEIAASKWAGRPSPAVGPGEWVELAGNPRAATQQPVGASVDEAMPTKAASAAGTTAATTGTAGSAVADKARVAKALSGSSAVASSAGQPPCAPKQSPNDVSTVSQMRVAATAAVPNSAASSKSLGLLPAALVGSVTLALCVANLAILGQWRLELTWE